MKKATLTLKSKHEQLMADAEELIEMATKRFPYMNYVGCPIFKENPATK